MIYNCQNRILFFLLLFFTISSIGQNKGEVLVPLSNTSAIGSLEVSIKKGTIHVIGSNREDVLIKYSKKEESSEKRDFESEIEESHMKEEIPIGMKKIGGSKIDLEIMENENIVSVKNSKIQNNIYMEIEIPYNFNVILKTYMGEGLSIVNVTGEVSLESDLGGYIKAENITGIINAITYSGDITISFKDIPKPTNMVFRNYSGNIDITLPPSYKSNLKLKTSQGDIFSVFSLDVDSNETELQQDTSSESFRVLTDSWIYAKLNGGGPEIKINSELGNIYLRPKVE